MKLMIPAGKKKLNRIGRQPTDDKVDDAQFAKVSLRIYIIHNGVFRNNQPLLRFPYICAV
jgi:hypothetical protein